MAASTGIDRETGKPLADWEHTTQSILVILSTHFGERVMRRVFGSAVPRVLGKNLVPETMLKFYMAVAIAIELWEPRFRVRRFEYPSREDGPDNMRQGKIGIRMIGDYMPRALEKDFTVEAVRTVAL
jgi:phage baseplate assembly protein W